jgi:hypothetical protein
MLDQKALTLSWYDGRVQHLGAHGRSAPRQTRDSGPRSMPDSAVGSLGPAASARCRGAQNNGLDPAVGAASMPGIMGRGYVTPSPGRGSYGNRRSALLALAHRAGRGSAESGDLLRVETDVPRGETRASGASLRAAAGPAPPSASTSPVGARWPCPTPQLGTDQPGSPQHAPAAGSRRSNAQLPDSAKGPYRAVPALSATPCTPRPAAPRYHACRKARRSALMVSACVVGMPCGKPW